MASRMRTLFRFLLLLKRPTLLTRDKDFWDSTLVHSRYAIVWIDVVVDETAFWIRRLMSHPQFRTSAQRLGKVVRVHPSAINYWKKNSDTPTVVEWSRWQERLTPHPTNLYACI